MGDARVLAFKEVYDEHFRFVWRSLRRLGIPESDVADAVQDVFLVVHRRLGEFEGRSKVTTWLYGICYRVAHDRRRLAHVRRRAPDDDGQLDDHADENADVAAAAEHRQGLALLEAILDALPIEQRAVFTLFELDGASGDAIAEMLEIPLGTVYSRLRLAREQFKKTVARLQARDRFRQTADGAGLDGAASGARARPGGPDGAASGARARPGGLDGAASGPKPRAAGSDGAASGPKPRAPDGAPGLDEAASGPKPRTSDGGTGSDGAASGPKPRTSDGGPDSRRAGLGGER